MKRLALALAAGLLTLGWGCGGNSTSVTNPGPPPPPTASPDVRADYLVSQMTIDEKLQLVHGGATASNPVTPLGAAGWVPSIPRLNIPDLFLADGSVGVGNGVGQATALPSSIASARPVGM
jgi:beta-glucosidase